MLAQRRHHFPLFDVPQADGSGEFAGRDRAAIGSEVGCPDGSLGFGERADFLELLQIPQDDLSVEAAAQAALAVGSDGQPTHRARVGG
jgi:hypothetical protein